MSDVDWQAILDNVPDGAEDWTHYDAKSELTLSANYEKHIGGNLYYWGKISGWAIFVSRSYGTPRQEIEKNALLQKMQKSLDDTGVSSYSVAAKSKHHREIKPGVWVDVYDVLDAFDPDNRNAADDHAIKKMLLPGKRGHKDGIKDRSEAIQSLQRSIQKIEEKQHEQAK